LLLQQSFGIEILLSNLLDVDPLFEILRNRKLEIFALLRQPATMADLYHHHSLVYANQIIGLQAAAIKFRQEMQCNAKYTAN